MSIIDVQHLKKYYQVHQKDPGLLGSLKSLVRRKYFDVKAVDDISFKINEGELIGFIGGFDKEEGELIFYKNEVDSLLSFLEDGVKLLNKSKIPFMTYGSLSLNPKVLDFLVEKGVHGIVVERYEAQSSYEFLRQSEKRLILRKTQ